MEHLNTDLGTSVEECFSNVSDAVEDIACTTITEIACDQRADPPYISSIPVVNITE